jgi:hypothetical protein
MYRVNVEARAFVDAPKVDTLMGWESGTALGKLVMIWGASQFKADDCRRPRPGTQAFAGGAR